MTLPSRPAGRSLLQAAAGIAGVTVAARLVGFGRTAVFTHTVGTSCLASTYTAVNAVPNVVFEVVAGGALASLVVPVLAPVVAAGDREAASRLVSALLTWTLVVLVPVALLGLVLAPLLVRGLVGGSPCARAEPVGTAMLRVFLPQVVLYGVAVVLTGVLQAHRRFLGPALAPLLSSLAVSAAYLLYAARGREPLETLSRGQELVLSAGTTLGVLVLAAALLPPLRSTGLRLRPSLSLPPGAAAQVRGLAGAGVAGLVAQQLALLVALRLSIAGSRSGAVVFTVATTLFLVPWAVLAVPVATSAFPRLAAAGPDERAALTARALRSVLLLTCAGAALLSATAGPAGRLLAAGPDLAQAVRAFAPGLVGYGLVALLTRVLYARGQGRTAATATVAGWAAVALADVLLVRGTDLRPGTALGLGNTVGMTLAALLLLRGVRSGEPGALDRTARTAAAAVAAGGLAAAAAGVVPVPGDGSVAAALVAAVLLAAVCLVVYGLVVAGADRAGLQELRRA